MRCSKMCLKSQWLNKKQNKTNVFYRLYLIVYEWDYRVFRDIRQRNRGPPRRISSFTLMANVTDYSNMMSPSLSVMSHLLVYFLLSLLNRTRGNTRHRHCFIQKSSHWRDNILPLFSISTLPNWSYSATGPRTNWAP